MRDQYLVYITLVNMIIHMYKIRYSTKSGGVPGAKRQGKSNAEVVTLINKLY